MSIEASFSLFDKGSSPALRPQLRVQASLFHTHTHTHTHRFNFPLRRKGFTLIELLVVIAIISLLVSILLPSLQAAKSLAQELVCTANLKQIGVAWHLYLIDNDDTFPKRVNNMQWFYGGKHPAIINEDIIDKDYMLKYRPLNPYADMLLQNESGIGLFRCPVDRAIISPGQPSITKGYDTYDYYGNCYMMNHNLLKFLGSALKLNEVEILESRLILAGDCQWYFSLSGKWHDANFHNYDDRVGMVFLDGHARFVQLILDETIPTDYSFSPYEPEEVEEE